MITQDEIKDLNIRLDIVKYLSKLGAYNIVKLKNKNEFRCPCWIRGGDNPNGMGISFDGVIERWICTDFTHRTFGYIDLITLGMMCEYTFTETINLMRSCVLEEGRAISLKNTKSFLEDDYETLRYISEDILSCFSVGLHPYLRDRGYLPQTAAFFELGFSCFYDLLQDRVTIPIRDDKGQLVAVQGRTTIDDDLRYCFIEGTGGYCKKLLYNLDKAKEEILNKGYVIVVEGCPSVWRLWQYGIKNTVATMSTSVTSSQLKLLMDLNVKIIIFFDYDDNNAGQLATIKLAKMLKEKNFRNNVYTTNIGQLGLSGSPDDIDANSVMKALYNIKKLF